MIVIVFYIFHRVKYLLMFHLFYQQIQKSPLKVRYGSAILCYLFLTILLYTFIILPKRPIQDAFLLGICVYGIYDTTTYALLKDYPLSLAVMDTLWGGILFFLVTYVYRLIRIE